MPKASAMTGVGKVIRFVHNKKPGEIFTITQIFDDLDRKVPKNTILAYLNRKEADGTVDKIYAGVWCLCHKIGVEDA